MPSYSQYKGLKRKGEPKGPPPTSLVLSNSVPWKWSRWKAIISLRLTFCFGLTYSENAAFWVFNRLAHFKYLFYNRVIDDIQAVQNELERGYQEQVNYADNEALALYSQDPQKAIAYLTDFSNQAGHSTVATWKELDNYLLVKYLDSNVKQEENGQFKRNGYGYPAKPKQPGYPDSWKKAVIEETGDRFRRP